MDKKICENRMNDLLVDKNTDIIEICKTVYAIIDEANMPELMQFFVEKLYIRYGFLHKWFMSSILFIFFDKH